MKKNGRDRTLIIAEAGVNHNGDIELAKQMVIKAKEAGADIIKFQTANIASLASKHAQMAQYQKDNTGKDQSQIKMLEDLVLSHNEFKELSLFCEKNGISFLSTPFDLDSIDFLNGLGCNMWKIPSGEITDLPYLVKIAKLGQPIIMSTGMCNMTEVKDAVDCLKSNGAKDISLLHCTTEYPAPFDEINLLAMNTIRKEFGLPVGYSDHSRGIEVPIAAVAMGACIIEKHFTLSKDMPGPDHKASLEPQELSDMISGIRNVEMAIGSAEKKITKSEMRNRSVARKSIVAKTEIKKGDLLTEANITTKRPGDGISPMKWFEVIGTKAKRNFEEDELIEI